MVARDETTDGLYPRRKRPSLKERGGSKTGPPKRARAEWTAPRTQARAGTIE